tara:strand:- start:525 stop:677 length:153 start_codon:yes stop_codon:yes gene_type:complete
MEFLAFPFIFFFWYLFYDAKPKRKDEIGLIWEEDYIIKRVKMRNILNDNS